jgi:DNA-binding IclR family transcriptional regulator
MLDWLASQNNGANLSRIAGKLNLDNAGARRIVKELMDEGCIEKVHQVYFFLKQTDK